MGCEITKNQSGFFYNYEYIFTRYFFSYRNFFNHRYHSNIMELIVDGLQKLETNDDEIRLLVSEDEPGYLLGLLHYLEDKEVNYVRIAQGLTKSILILT